MIARRIALVGALLLAGLSGLVGGALFVALREPLPQFWEIPPEERKNEVDGMFADYKAGRVLYTAMLPVFGTRLKVRVVHNRFRGEDYGFIPASDFGEMPTHLWYFRASEFNMKKYDNETIFVSLNDRYVNDMKRNPAESGYSPASW